MPQNTKGRVKQILNDCCAGNASLATDILHGEFVIIPREDLPNGTPNEAVMAVEVEGVSHSVWPLTHPAAVQAYKDALEYLAAAEAINHWTSKQEVLKRERDKRRDELSAEFTAVKSYGGQLPYTQKLIDRIIELESKTAA